MVVLRQDTDRALTVLRTWASRAQCRGFSLQPWKAGLLKHPWDGSSVKRVQRRHLGGDGGGEGPGQAEPHRGSRHTRQSGLAHCS